MNVYKSAEKDTMYFIGVTTSKSSIMKVFPKWMEHFDIKAEIKGFDFEPHADPKLYQEAVEFIKHDAHSLGALVTTHKLDLLKACKHQFDGLGEYATLLNEVSSISKRGKELWGHAKDPITSGLSLDAIVDESYWNTHGGDLLLLGAGGSSLALTLYLINKRKKGKSTPNRIVICNRSQPRLTDMQEIHKTLQSDIQFEYYLCPEPSQNDKIVDTLAPYSVVANGTGLGKDRPGSPLTDAVNFPENSVVWDFNYRGDLIFLDQARNQQKEKNITIEDGWLYFVYGWTQVIAEVFHIDIPTSGAGFDELSDIANSIRS